MLVASTSSAGPVANRLKALPFIQVVQDASDGVNAVFPLEFFAEVTAIMRPRKRRQLSEEQRARLVEAGAKYRFSAGAHDAPEGSVCDEEGSRV